VRANPHPGITLITLSGRGDKDIHTVATASGHQEYLA
jgi:tryptophan synthase beta subunit